MLTPWLILRIFRKHAAEPLNVNFCVKINDKLKSKDEISTGSSLCTDPNNQWNALKLRWRESATKT